MSNASDLGTVPSGGAGPYGGNIGNYGSATYNNALASQGVLDVPYQGYDTNYGPALTPNAAGTNASQPYFGFMTNYSGGDVKGANNKSTTQVFQEDNQMVYPFPKDQQIYYKLRGFNTNTQSYETWIISEEIVPHLEQFDPTQNPPSVDLNVFFAPPSGNILSNIRIVGRWIQ
jgi:hypothetical protein